jgi:PIN domain nuclease of toxin-antitoxin system
MRLLLDTHIWLWFLDGDSRLPPTIKSAILDSENEVWISTISLFETAIKMSIGKLNTENHLEKMTEATLASGIKILPLTAAETFQYQNIPLLENHKDPFDRMLLAISNAHNFTFVSIDEKIKLYSDCVQLLK